MELVSISSLKDNYIWVLHNNKQCIIIDPGESKPVFQILKNLNIVPIAIFLTHYHKDHTEGIPELVRYYTIPVYGPQNLKENTNNSIITSNNSPINILNLNFKTIPLPGHTPEHIGFYNHPWLFCGDTIFPGGCGKIYDGAEKKMYQSLQKIKKLNKNTLICSAHEYTLSNIQFSRTIMKQDINLIFYESYIKKQRNNKQQYLPSKLKDELKINLFLRCHENTLKTALGLPLEEEEWKVFAQLRKRRNNYPLY